MDMDMGIAYHVTIKPRCNPAMKPTRIHGTASAWVVYPSRLPSQQIRTINGNPCCCLDITPACTKKWRRDFALILAWHGMVLPRAREIPDKV